MAYLRRILLLLVIIIIFRAKCVCALETILTQIKFEECGGVVHHAPVVF